MDLSNGDIDEAASSQSFIAQRICHTRLLLGSLFGFYCMGAVVDAESRVRRAQSADPQINFTQTPMPHCDVAIEACGGAGGVESMEREPVDVNVYT